MQKKHSLGSILFNTFIIVISVILLLIALVFGASASTRVSTKDTPKQIETFMTAFVKQMPEVNLTGAPADVKSAMVAHYADYLSPELLATWENDPVHALGSTANEVPGTLEILAIQKTDELSYVVKGNLNLTVTDKGKVTTQQKYVIFGLSRYGFSWRISEYLPFVPK